MSESKLMVGGQAVIEGVMMRTPEMVTVACRRADGTIAVWKKPFRSWLARHRFLSLPVVRGAIVLLEALALGLQALAYSGDLAERDAGANNDGQAPERERLPGARTRGQKFRLAFSLVVALAFGLGIFFYVPLLLTDWLGARTGFWFNLIDGAIRLVFFLAYIILIAQMRDIRRVFEYHGAEHKSIFNYEARTELTPENSAKFSRFHPRCGTSFLLIVMIVSIFVFMALGRPETVADRLLRLAFIPVIGGISYEFIRLSGKGYGHPFWNALIAPGLWLQRLTTREPNHGQLEVAIIALKAALGEEVESLPHVIVEGQGMVEAQAA